MTLARTFLALSLVALVVAGAGLWRTLQHPAGTTDPRKIAIVSRVYGGVATASAVSSALHAVRVVAARPFPGGYDRDCGPSHACSFGPAWSDATDAADGHNGCDTRNDVLREQLVGASVDPRSFGCKVVAGTLVDPYTGRVVDFAQDHFDVEIDHVVPLAYAWDMGAAAWSQQQRDHFANDTSIELLASWGPANQEKGDSGPGAWLPQDATFRCDYVLRFLQVIRTYGLAITAADARAVERVAEAC